MGITYMDAKKLFHMDTRRPFWISFPRSILPEASETIGRAVWMSGAGAAASDENSSSKTIGSSGANRAFRVFRLPLGRRTKWRRWSLCAGMRF